MDDQTLPPAASPIVKAKADYQQNVKDAARLAQLAAEVKQELETGGAFALSVASLKKAEEMEKLSKKLHSRMKEDYTSAPTPPMVDVSKH